MNAEGQGEARAGLQHELASIVGEQNVLAGEEDRAFYSQDIYSEGTHAAFVVRPGSPEEVGRVAATATGAGYTLIARGGGTSYTGGFLPDRPESVIVDTLRLNGIVEINADDMYVTVQVGCTWKELYLALKPLGLRTPFFGPLSGGNATVGGSLSQHTVLLGSALHGASADTVLGLEVVLADGSVVATGSGSTRGGKPFFRHYGPDLTGLFLGDTGALGVKVAATLKLMRIPAVADFASFEFTEQAHLAEAMTELARARVATVCFGMDPVLQAQRMKRTSLTQDVKKLKGVVTSAGSLVGGVKEAVKVAVAGRKFLDEASYSVHLIVEGRDKATLAGRMEEVRRICLRHGREAENTIPKVIHGDPYFPMSSAIGPDGERWAPMHGILPLSEADAAWSRIRALFGEYAERCEQHGVVIGFLLATVATNAFVIEPVFYWPGPRPLYYDRVLDASYLAKLKRHDPNPEAAELVAEMRTRLARLFLELGAAHLQVGKTYLYREGRRPETWRLLEAIKSAVDPQRRVNPGSLGLE